MKWSAKMKHARVISIIVCLLVMVVAVNMGCGGKPSEQETDSTADITKTNAETKPTNVNGWNGAYKGSYPGAPESLLHEANSTSLSLRAFEFDSKGRPHILYNDRQKYQMFYCSVRDGDRWISLDGKKGTNAENYLPKDPDGNLSMFDCMKIDKNDRIHFIRIDEKGIVYLIWNGNSWETLDGKNQKTEGITGLEIVFPKVEKFSRYDADFYLDSKGLPHLFYERSTFNDPNDYFYYYFWNGDEWIETDETNYEKSNQSEDLSIPEMPVSIEHIDERGYLHHIGYANENFDLLHTMWNGQEWVNVRGESVPAEGGESCIFYRNYNDRPPTDFLVKSFGNNLYIMWRQWSQEGVGVGVCENLHYMEWIEE